jgi:hypothetical protein
VLVADSFLPAAERQGVAYAQLDHVVDERADAQLRPWKILQEGDRPAGSLARRAYSVGVLGVLLVGGVGEVEAGHVHAGFDHAHENFGIARSRAYRRDDLGAAHEADAIDSGG